LRFIGLRFTGDRVGKADELLLSWGGGAQPRGSQDNRQQAIDYSFYAVDRSSRSRLSLGVSYTRITMDAGSQRTAHVLSLYPQLTLIPTSAALDGFYFYVRALGPSYLSENVFGTRRQANHFTFQAQAGIGYEQVLTARQTLLVQLSWKHFSNANLFSANDGIDLPLVLSLGLRF
jgi:hypothetical protein